MPFIDDEPTYGPLALPEGLEVTPKPKPRSASVLDAAFRIENEIGSISSSFRFDPQKPFDPEFRPWEEIQGTEYEHYASRFVGAQDSEDIAAMKAQIDREVEDNAVLDASAWGVPARMAGAILSPTSLIPGGAVVKGAKGVNIARTALKIGASAAVATGIQEALLHQSQQLRTGEESAFAIGGAFILGGILGAAAGKLSSKEFKAAGLRTETAIEAVHGYVEMSRSIGAKALADENFRLNNEGLIQAVKKVPVLRHVVQSDPLIRLQTAESLNARKVIADLAESPSVYEVNKEGISSTGQFPVETEIKTIRYDRETKAVQALQSSYARYWKDGPVGTIGTLTAPISRTFAHLAGQTEKMSPAQFMEEVGRAMFSNDTHPIAQVAEAASKVRELIFAQAERDLIDLGVLPEGFKLKHGESYFTRVYNSGLIDNHWGDGSELDMKPVLEREIRKRAADAVRFLAEDDTLNRREIDLLHQRELARNLKGALSTAREKAVAKRERAKAAAGRDGAVSRVSARLRKAFKDRQSQIEQGVPDKDATKALKEMIADARGLKRIEPVDILKEIRRMGGIKEDGSGKLKAALDTKYLTIYRKGGLDPDYAREALEELGYLPQGATVNDMYDIIRRAADGEKVYSQIEDAADIARYEAAVEFADEMDKLGVDLTRPFDEIVSKLYGKVDVKKAKAGEAGRAAKRTGGASDAALARVEKAMDRLEEAKTRIRELDEEIGPKVRQEIKDAVKEAQKLVSEIRDLKKTKATEERFAKMDDADITDAADEIRNSIVGLKVGEPHYGASLSNPLHARVLDMPSEVLLPWLKTNAMDVLSHYSHTTLPRIEMMKRFGGDVEMGAELRAIRDEYNNKIAKLPENSRRRAQLVKERDRTIKDVEGVRDRILGRYGLPADPKQWWVVGGRIGRTVSYPAYLGNMVIAAVPDIGNLLRNGFEAALALPDFIMNPRRFIGNAADASEYAAAAEWFMNSRAHTMAELMDPLSQNTRVERFLAEGARHFSVYSGMIPWNFTLKSLSGMIGSSRLGKAVVAANAGKATKRQLRLLGESIIDGRMVERIAAQIEAHADRSGPLWALKGAEWTDQEAYSAVRKAMAREIDLQVMTPGQDVPLTFSNEGMKFFLQFKRFTWSMHHRFLLAGISRADAEFASQAVLLMTLGAVVSNLRADLGGYERKTGGDLFVDAIDRAGISGWLMEAHNMQGMTGVIPFVTGGRFDGLLGKELPSRYQARSGVYSLAGPTVDMIGGLAEGLAGLNSKSGGTYKDIRKLMRPLPGNNAAHLQWIMQRIEDALVDATGAKPRPD